MDMLNMDDFDAELFHLQESSTNRKQPNIDQEHSYLHYLQTTAQDFFYDPIYQQQYISNMPNIGLNLDMPDYTFSSEQKSQYNWLCDPNNTLLCDDSMMIMPPTPTTHNPSYDCIMSESDNIMVEGGMSRGYVSLSDVNSFVAKADSAKHSCLLLSNNLLLDDFPLKQPQRDFLSSSESTNDESEDEYSDNNSELDLRWPHLTGITAKSTHKSNARQKVMIKIKKSAQNNALPSPYGEAHSWDLLAPKVSKSTNCRNMKQQRKSMSNIYGMTAQQYKKKKSDTKGRRGSAPNRIQLHNSHSNASLNSLHSSSSLSSLSNNLQRSMRVSDSLYSFLSHHSSSDVEEELLEGEEDVDDDEDDEEYQQIRSTTVVAAQGGQLPTMKKGRNVDKACNHCKRSHLRCDDMRPCRRCVATGKTGCKDVQHKPRGRPKLHKK